MPVVAAVAALESVLPDQEEGPVTVGQLVAQLKELDPRLEVAVVVERAYFAGDDMRHEEADSADVCGCKQLSPHVVIRAVGQ